METLISNKGRIGEPTHGDTAEITMLHGCNVMPNHCHGIIKLTVGAAPLVGAQNEATQNELENQIDAQAQAGQSET